MTIQFGSNRMLSMNSVCAKNIPSSAGGRTAWGADANAPISALGLAGRKMNEPSGSERNLRLLQSTGFSSLGYFRADGYTELWREIVNCGRRLVWKGKCSMCSGFESVLPF